MCQSFSSATLIASLLIVLRTLRTSRWLFTRGNCGRSSTRPAQRWSLPRQAGLSHCGRTSWESMLGFLSSFFCVCLQGLFEPTVQVKCSKKGNTALILIYRYEIVFVPNFLMSLPHTCTHRHLNFPFPSHTIRKNFISWGQRCFDWVRI